MSTCIFSMMQLNSIVVNRLAADISVEAPKVYETGSGKHMKCSLSFQMSTDMLYLQRYGQLNSLSFPTVRGSADVFPISWLSSDTTREQVFKSFSQDWQSIIVRFSVTYLGNP